MIRVKNILNQSNLVGKIGVLEISTRACKLVVADVQQLTKGFYWKAFYNDATLTNTGHLLNENNELDWSDFRTKVLPSIKMLVKKAKSLQVHHLCCVATAALRSAVNRDEIIEKVKSTCNVIIQILTQEEEAKATMAGFQWKTHESFYGNAVLMEQLQSSNMSSSTTHKTHFTTCSEPSIPIQRNM